jgi:hypothetical protein
MIDEGTICGGRRGGKEAVTSGTDNTIVMYSTDIPQQKGIYREAGVVELARGEAGHGGQGDAEKIAGEWLRRVS